MRIFDLSGVVDPNRLFKPSRRTFYNIDSKIKEVIDSLSRLAIGLPTTTDIYILYGCVDTGTGGSPINYNISAGAVYYNGEIFLTDSASFTATGANVAVANIIITYDPLDPSIFTDGTTHNVHSIRKIQWQDGVSGSGIKDFSTAIKIGQWIPVTSFTNSWVATTFSPTPFAPAFRLGLDGRVYLRGGVTKATGDNTSAFTLPTICRPQAALNLPCIAPGAGGQAQVQIKADGSVIPVGTGTNPKYVFDGVAFDTYA